MILLSHPNDDRKQENRGEENLVHLTIRKHPVEFKVNGSNAFSQVYCESTEINHMKNV